MMLQKIFNFSLFLFGLVLLSKPVYAQSPQDFKPETLEAEIIQVVTEKEGKTPNQLYQKLKLQISKGSLVDEKIEIENGHLPMAQTFKYRVGDKVLVNYYPGPEGKNQFIIADYIRHDGLILLFLIFAGLTLLIGKFRGLFSLLALIFSFGIIFVVILPLIYKGYDPVLAAIIGSLLIVPVTFFVSHGFNKKTQIAVISTIIALVITGILATIFVNLSKLTGFASEEASFLQFSLGGAINMKNLLLAGIIISVLGVLDDVTVAQASLVKQLLETKKNISNKELYSRAMQVGQDHIASMINTLVLVYAGASLPLLLLFLDSSKSFGQVINYELIADEIVRTLVGSIGLILAVPITTFLAVYLYKRKHV